MWPPTVCGSGAIHSHLSYAHGASHMGQAPIKIASLISLAVGNEFLRIGEEVDLIAHCYSNSTRRLGPNVYESANLLECQTRPWLSKRKEDWLVPSFPKT